MTKYFIFIMIPIGWPHHMFNANREAGDFSEKIPPVTWAVALKTALCLVKSLCGVKLFPLHVAVSIHSLRFRNNSGHFLGVWVYNCVWYIKMTNWKISVDLCCVQVSNWQVKNCYWWRQAKQADQEEQTSDLCPRKLQQSQQWDENSICRGDLIYASFSRLFRFKWNGLCAEVRKSFCYEAEQLMHKSLLKAEHPFGIKILKYLVYCWKKIANFYVAYLALLEKMQVGN